MITTMDSTILGDLERIADGLRSGAIDVPECEPECVAEGVQADDDAATVTAKVCMGRTLMIRLVDRRGRRWFDFNGNECVRWCLFDATGFPVVQGQRAIFDMIEMW